MTETGLPWIVRLTPDDRQTGYRLARLVFEERGLSRVAVLRSSNRYGRFGVREFRDAARRLGRPLPMEVQFAPGQEDFTSELDRLEAGKIGVNDILIKVLAETLARHPEVNASWSDDGIRRHGSVDIGIAVAVEEGLITPIVRSHLR